MTRQASWECRRDSLSARRIPQRGSNGCTRGNAALPTMASKEPGSLAMQATADAWTDSEMSRSWKIGSVASHYAL